MVPSVAMEKMQPLVLAVSLLLCGMSEGQNQLGSPGPSPGGDLSMPVVIEHMSQHLDNVLQPLMDMILVPGKMYSNPAASCKEIKNYSHESGYYWIRTYAGTPVQVFCDMNVMCGCSSEGGWMRLESMNMSAPGSMCPENLTKWEEDGTTGCVKSPDEACSSVILPTLGVKYSKVCGMAKGYQWGLTDAFRASSQNDINGAYVDGISITHGHARKHVWTMAAAQHEVASPNPMSLCSCTNTRNRMNLRLSPPSFVGDDYFCETGTHERASERLYADDRLWDGEGCGALSTCCRLNSPPWFCKTLSCYFSDHLEVRLCTQGPSTEKNVILKELQLFVQ